MLMKKLFLLSLLLCSVCSHASVYRCEQNGVTLFSQTPCADNAVELAQYDTTPTAAVDSDALTGDSSHTADSLQQLSLKLRQQSLERQLQRLSSGIRQLEHERDTKLAELTDGDVQSPDDVAGRRYLAGVAGEMRAVLNHYQLEISKVQQQADQIRQQLQQLQAL